MQAKDSILEAGINNLLTTAYAELEPLLEQQSQLEAEIALITRRIMKLAVASDDKQLIDSVRETSFTDGLRIILVSETEPLTSVEIRTRFLEIGFNVEGYSNFLASLYLTLERMKRQGEVIEGTNDEGKKVYRKAKLSKKSLKRKWNVALEKNG